MVSCPCGAGDRASPAGDTTALARLGQLLTPTRAGLCFVQPEQFGVFGVFEGEGMREL